MDVVYDSRDQNVAGLLDDLLTSGKVDQINYRTMPDEATVSLCALWPMEHIICEGFGATTRDAAMAALEAYEGLCAEHA